jgi:hypothetical protein
MRAHIPTPEPPQDPDGDKRPPRRPNVPGEIPPTPRETPTPIDDPKPPQPSEPVRDPSPDETPNPKRY